MDDDLFFFPFLLSFPNLKLQHCIPSEGSYSPLLLIGYLNQPVYYYSENGGRVGGFDGCMRCYKTTAATNPASLYPAVWKSLLCAY